MPRSASRSPSRCRKTSPRALAMSRIPMVNPSRRSGRGRRGRTVGLRSDVGSRSTAIFTSLRPQPSFPRKREPRAPRAEQLVWAPACAGATIGWSGSYLLGYGKAAAGAARGPAADDAGKHSGIAAGADDHQPARTEFVYGLAGERGPPAFGNPLGSGDEFVARDFAQTIELFIKACLRPAGVLECAVMFWADHQERVARRRVLEVAEHPQRSGKALRQAPGLARLLVDNPLQTVTGEHRHRRLARLQPALDRQRLPARSLLVLGKAIGEFAGVAEGGTVDLLRPPLADIANDQLQSTADCGVGADAFAERVAFGVHADAAADRAVDDDHRSDEHRRCQYTVHRKALVENRLDRGQHNRQIFGLAARHHRIDRDLLDGGGD